MWIGDTDRSVLVERSSSAALWVAVEPAAPVWRRYRQ
jgi:hypothetical protein